MKKNRRHLDVADKIKAIKRHLLDGEPVSSICEELGVSPSNFYGWQKLLFENAEKAFTRENNAEVRKAEAKAAALEQKLRSRDEALAELMAEDVALKKRSTGRA
jgi:transposase-like protein